MRRLLQILLATAVLTAGHAYSATDHQPPSISIYIVSREKIDGGRFINTPDLPKLGYIAARPDLVITRLVTVKETVSHSSTVKVEKDGKRIETPLPDRPVLDITISPEDAKKLETLTENNIGKRALIMAGDMPMFAPYVRSPISAQSFEIDMGDHDKQKAVEDELKKLVR